MSEAPAEQRWRILFTPRWLGWHLFAVVAFFGMLWLGDWQLHRALSGNALSWAYTFEWPIFAVFGVVFWTKTVRDELHPKPVGDDDREEISLPAGARRPSGRGLSTDAAESAGTGQPGLDGAGAAYAGLPGDAGAEGTSDGEAHVESWEPQDTELDEYNAYLARLNAEVKRHGKWHGLR